MSEPKKRMIGVRLTEDEHRAAKHWAVRQGLTLTAAVRELLAREGALTVWQCPSCGAGAGHDSRRRQG